MLEVILSLFIKYRNAFCPYDWNIWINWKLNCLWIVLWIKSSAKPRVKFHKIRY